MEGSEKAGPSYDFWKLHFMGPMSIRIHFTVSQLVGLVTASDTRLDNFFGPLIIKETYPHEGTSPYLFVFFTRNTPYNMNED